MEEQGYYEVETPFLHPILGGANAKPFITHFNALDRDYYLRIATELPLKRLLVGGFEKVFEIGRQFRNEGMDPYHNPEFTTMEAYEAFGDLESMMNLTEGLHQGRGHGRVRNAPDQLPGHRHRPVRHLAAQVHVRAGLRGRRHRRQLRSHPRGLVAILERNGGHAEAAWGSGKLIAEIFEAVAEEKLIQPTFVIDHPLEISPLAKKHPENPELTQRFELFILGHEYGNAFTELNDPVDQAERFRAQVAAKDMGDDEAMGFDADYIRALEYGMPPAGGVGIGIDRLVMLLTDAPSIRDVLLFPHMRDESPVQASASARPCGFRGRRACGGRVRAQQGADARLLEGGRRAPVRRRGRLRHLQQVRLPHGEGEGLRRRSQEQEAAAVHARRRHGEDRTILSGIHANYEPEDLIGRTLIAITNLPPRKMMGVYSCGMIISAIHEEDGEERLNVLMVDDRIPAGAKLY